FLNVFISSGSPAALRHPGDVALERELAEAQAAQRELPHIGARAAAQVAAVAQPNLVLRLLLFLRDLGGRGHSGFLPNSCQRGGTACRQTAAAFALPRPFWRRSPRTRSCRAPCRPSCSRSPGRSTGRAVRACNCRAHRSPWARRL